MYEADDLGKPSGKYYAWDHNLPCKNPNCKSHGKPHPNCQCYAEGGAVCAINGKHSSGCQFFAEGGEAMPAPAHPSMALGHAALSHGLLGLIGSVGKASMVQPDGHLKLMNEARDHHAYRKRPTGIEPKKTQGSKLADQLLDQNHDDAADAFHGHPLFGGSSKGATKAVIARLGTSLLDREPDPEAVRASSDYLNSSIRGNDSLQGHISGLLSGSKKDNVKIDMADREKLKSRLEEIGQDPQELLEVGGKIGHYLPDHATELGAFAARSVEYLNSIKPQPLPLGPLDEPQKPDGAAMQQWDRQLDIAQKPLVAMNFLKDGTLTTKDVTTLRTLYPSLYDSMSEKLGEEIVNHKTKEKRIPYTRRVSLSIFLGQPMDATMQPSIMQGIMAANGAQLAKNQAQNEKRSKHQATSVAMKEIDQANSLSETRLEKRQINRKS